jgi:glycerol-3-phosphate dehydrogenase
LTRRFGSEASLLKDAIDRDPALGELVEGTAALKVEVLWARQAEGALDSAEAADTRLRVTMIDDAAAAAQDAVKGVWDSI